MKKILVPALTASMLIGAVSTAGAAMNPFSDVPANHWAYDSITKLAEDGIIEGYGDGTFRGNRNVTRYEMAQMIARALARISEIPIVTSDRAELSKLAAEFKDELKTLGVNAEDIEDLGIRIAKLEKHADVVKWRSKIEYEYDYLRTDPDKTGTKNTDVFHGYIFRFEPSATINENWSANARLDAYVEVREDSTTNVEPMRIWAEGDYDKFNIKLGKQEFWTNEMSLVWDTDFSGAVLTAGDKVQGSLFAGRLSEQVGGGQRGELASDDEPADIFGVNVQYNADSGLSGGLGWYNVKDDDLKTELYSRGGNDNKANIWTVNAAYRFSENANLWGAYAKNSKADYEDNSMQIQLEFGNYISDYGIAKGDWGLWTGYRRFGTNTSFAPLEDDVIKGAKGWFVGGAYAPFDNLGLMAKYFNGEYITGGGDAEKFMLLMELFM